MDECLGPPKGCILVLSGLPASGKTTLANEIVCRLGKISGVGQSVVLHICYDKILSSDTEKTLIESDETCCTAVMESDKATSPWKLYRQSIVCCVDRFQDAIQGQTLPVQPENVEEEVWQTFLHSLSAGGILETLIAETSSRCYILVIDDNMYYRSMRYDYYQLARKYGIGYCQIHVDCSLSAALWRNRQRADSVPDHVITEMNRKFEPPDSVQHPWEVYSYSHDSKQTLNLADIASMVSRAIGDPVKSVKVTDLGQVEESKRICSESVVHQLDQILRKLVKHHILEAKDEMTNKDTLKNYASELNRVKSQLLTDLKAGVISLSSDMADNMHEDSRNVDSRLFKFIEELFQTRLDTTSTL